MNNHPILFVIFAAAWIAVPAYAANECRISYAFEMGSGAGLKSFTEYKYINLGNAINIDKTRIKWVKNLRNPHVRFEFAPAIGVANITLGRNQRNPLGVDFVNKPTLLKAVCLTPQEQTAFVSGAAAAEETARKLPRQAAGTIARKTDQAAAGVMHQTGQATGVQPRINAVGDGHYQNAHPANAVAPTQQKPLKYGLNRVTIVGSHLGGITRIDGLPEKATTRFVSRAPNYLNLDIRIPTSVQLNTRGSARLVAGRSNTNQRFSWVIAGKRQAPVVDLYPITGRRAGVGTFSIGNATRAAMLNGQQLTFRNAYPTTLCRRTNAGVAANVPVQAAIAAPVINIPDYRWGIGVSNQDAEQHNLSGPIVVELWRGNNRLDSRNLRNMQLQGGNRQLFTSRRPSRTLQVYRIAGDNRNCWTLENPATSLLADNTVQVRVDTTQVVREANEGNNRMPYGR